MRFAASLVILCLSTAIAAAADRPHVVFFFVDDLGWADVGCYGSSFHETPHIDALAASGVKFTDAYSAASICSPTRASLMSGKHPARVGITDWIPGARPPRWATLRTPEDRHFLPLEEFTFAEAMREAGYRTWYGGKWHLSGSARKHDKRYDPQQQGFDEYLAPAAWTARGTPRAKDFDRPHGTAEITAGAIDYLRQHAEGQEPMLLVLAYNDVHTPVVPVKEQLDRYRQKLPALGDAPAPIAEGPRGKTRARQDSPEYATMVGAVDASVGEVLGTIDELGIADDTIVVFFSDNGGLATRATPGPTCNAPLRSGKGWLYEGGIRVPLVVRAPGVTTEGAECETPVTSMDLYPTLLDLTGCPLRPDQHVDGVSLKPALDGSAALADRHLAWHYPHYHGSTWAPGGAIRDGDWKLIEFFETGRVELYNLAEDLGESRDLAESRPDVVERLRSELDAWRVSVGAKMPTAL